MITYIARETATYTSTDGTVTRLVSRGDYLRQQSSLTPECAHDELPLVSETYAYTRVKTGLLYRYTIEPYYLFATRSDAERECELLMRSLMLAREGTLSRESAYLGSTPTLITDWQAMISNITPTPLECQSNPEIMIGKQRSWYAIKYELTLTNPT